MVKKHITTVPFYSRPQYNRQLIRSKEAWHGFYITASNVHKLEEIISDLEHISLDIKPSLNKDDKLVVCEGPYQEKLRKEILTYLETNNEVEYQHKEGSYFDFLDRTFIDEFLSR
jgi:hypothetical protein